MYILWIMLIFLVLYLVMTIMGPTVWDRLLGVGLISSKIIVMVLVFSSYEEIAYLLDYATIYALSGFIGTIFIALYWGRKKRGK